MTPARMGMIVIRVEGDQPIVMQFRHGAVAMTEATARTTRHYGQLLTTRIQAKASGRPGPNAPTGDYRRSIHLIFRAEGLLSGTYTAAVGTNKPQGRRLEFGFAGADALGRVYDQPPYPHFGPAFDEIGPQFERAMEQVVQRL